MFRNENDFQKEERKRQFYEKLSYKLQDGRDWVIRNRDMLVAVVPVAVGGITTVTKVVSKRRSQRKEAELRNLYCYDRSLGHYWRLRRNLSNTEWLEIDRRKSNGERLADILSELKVLK